MKTLIRLAKSVDRDRNEILAWIKHRVTSAKLEAFNATISRIVKRACGYRDLGPLYLKIRQKAHLLLRNYDQEPFVPSLVSSRSSGVIVAGEEIIHYCMEIKRFLQNRH